MEIPKIGTTPLNTRRINAETSLEQVFILEMMKLAMPDSSKNSFSGGIGEAQFSSWMTDIQANMIADRFADTSFFLKGPAHD